jgi:hypothetical protein
MDSEKLKQVVLYALGVASLADDRDARELGPIHLLKFAYLADFAHAKHRDGKTFTGVAWRFYKLGPWDEEAHSVIERTADASGATKRLFDWGGARDGTRWSVADGQLADRLLRIGDQLPSEVTSAIQWAVKTFGTDTYRLLDHVYLTSPMLHAAPGERLAFSVMPMAPERGTPDEGTPRASDPAPSPISKSEAKRRRAAWVARRDGLRERVRAGGSRRRLVPAPAEPIYDSVFDAGLAALDGMAGPAIPQVAGTVQFSPEMWKSRGRRESDIS